MPLPAIVGPGTVLAIKKLAWHLLATADLGTISAATFTFLCLKYGYQSLPAWVKEDVSLKMILNQHNNGRKKKDDGSNGGLQLQHLLKKITEFQSMIPDVSLPSILALIQLSAQLKQDQKLQHSTLTSQPMIMATSNEDTECPNTVAGEENKQQDSIDVESPASSTTSLSLSDMYANAGEVVDLSELRSTQIRHALDLAAWSYHEDSDVLERKLLAAGYGMLCHELNVRPGTVAHYVAVHPTDRTVVVSLRGTSTLEDFLTDCLGLPKPLTDDNSLGRDSVRVEVKAAVPNVVLTDPGDDTVEIVSGHERIILEDHDDDGDMYVRCHEGMLTAARNVLNVIGRFLRDYVTQCDYTITLVGHSLGAGTAIVAAQLLRSKFPELSCSNRIKVFAFAPPPVLDHDSALAATSYCTTIVNGSDIIPRTSISNLLVLSGVLREVERRMIEHEINPSDPGRTVKFINKLSEGEKGKPLMTAVEFQQTVRNSQLQVALRTTSNLFVPGRVLLVYKQSSASNDDDNTDDEGQPKSTCWKCVETTGTNDVFQTFKVDMQCFTDHLTSSYYEALGMEYFF